MNVTPLRHTGDSANIAYYAEPAGPIWCEVTRHDPFPPKRPDGTRYWASVRGKPPRFNINIYEHGVGEIAKTTYAPKSKPRPGRLPERTVTRLVRAALGEPVS